MEEIIKFIKNLPTERNTLNHMLGLTLGVTLIITIINTRSYLAPDTIFFLFLVLVYFFGKSKGFIRDWGPVTIFLLAYDSLHGVVDNLNKRVVAEEVIIAEKFIFRGIPTLFLQEKLYQQGTIRWYDVLGVYAYISHFIVPLSFGLYLWLKKRDEFHFFAKVFLTTSYLGLLTFLALPVMPPWMAMEKNLLPSGAKIMYEVALKYGIHGFPTIYLAFNPNEVAAFPSLHAAYPLIVLIFCLRLWGKKGLMFLFYPLIVWFSVIYLGEHYVVDIIGGIIYVVLVYLTLFYAKKAAWAKKLAGGAEVKNGAEIAAGKTAHSLIGNNVDA